MLKKQKRQQPVALSNPFFLQESQLSRFHSSISLRISMSYSFQNLLFYARQSTAQNSFVFDLTSDERFDILGNLDISVGSIHIGFFHAQHADLVQKLILVVCSDKQ